MQTVGQDDARYVIPNAGMIVGNSMRVASVTAVRLVQDAGERRARLRHQGRAGHGLRQPRRGAPGRIHHRTGAAHGRGGRRGRATSTPAGSNVTLRGPSSPSRTPLRCAIMKASFGHETSGGTA